MNELKKRLEQLEKEVDFLKNKTRNELSFNNYHDTIMSIYLYLKNRDKTLLEEYLKVRTAFHTLSEILNEVNLYPLFHGSHIYQLYGSGTKEFGTEARRLKSEKEHLVVKDLEANYKRLSKLEVGEAALCILKDIQEIVMTRLNNIKNEEKKND